MTVDFLEDPVGGLVRTKGWQRSLIAAIRVRILAFEVFDEAEAPAVDGPFSLMGSQTLTGLSQEPEVGVKSARRSGRVITGCDEAAFVGGYYQLCAVSQSELGQDSADVGLCR